VFEANGRSVVAVRMERAMETTHDYAWPLAAIHECPYSSRGSDFSQYLLRKLVEIGLGCRLVEWVAWVVMPVI
jgi:hypothetical protein